MFIVLVLIIFIAKYLKKRKIKLPVLTGDMMNEFFADYQNGEN